jgi:hypothetical protein
MHSDAFASPKFHPGAKKDSALTVECGLYGGHPGMIASQGKLAIDEVLGRQVSPESARPYHCVVLMKGHPRRLMKDDVRYYHDDRTHLGLNKGAPAGHKPEKEPGAGSPISSMPKLAGCITATTALCCLCSFTSIPEGLACTVVRVW